MESVYFFRMFECFKFMDLQSTFLVGNNYNIMILFETLYVNVL